LSYQALKGFYGADFLFFSLRNQSRTGMNKMSKKVIFAKIAELEFERD